MSLPLSTDPNRAPEPPSGLGPSGCGLWVAVTTRYSLRYGDELFLLAEAARVLDWTDRLQHELVRSDLVVKGSMGQPAANPLLGEVRGLRSQFASLMKQLGLPDEAVSAGQAPKSPRHVAAAQARWARRDAAVTAAHQRADDGAL